MLPKRIKGTILLDGGSTCHRSRYLIAKIATTPEMTPLQPRSITRHGHKVPTLEGGQVGGQA